MKIAIATDTNSGITQAQAQELGLFVLPMPVLIDGKMYFEGQDIDHQTLYAAMKEHRDISTSQPSPGQVMEFWDGILAQGYDAVVYIPMSSGLSGSCANAIQFAGEYGGKVQVVDNHRISVTEAESALCALSLAKQGRTAQEIRAHLEKYAFDSSIYITVDSMEYLKKGGRVTPVAATFATVLNLKPVLTIQGDKLDAFAKVRGMRQAEARMIEAMQADRTGRFGSLPDEEVIVATAGTLEDPALAESWRAQVQAAFPFAQVEYAQLPCCIACHVGINAAGIGIIRKVWQ